MDLQARKIYFVQEFLRLQDEEIIGGLESYLKKKKIEMIEKNLTPMSIEQFKQEIDQALTDVEEGRMIKASDLKKKVQKWN